MREQERRDREKRDNREVKTSAALSLTIPKVPPVEGGPHPRASDGHGFHRPFERTLTNGYERDHFTEYERRLMTEHILAQDRKVLPGENHVRVEPSSHNGKGGNSHNGKPEPRDLARDVSRDLSMKSRDHSRDNNRDHSHDHGAHEVRPPPSIAPDKAHQEGIQARLLDSDKSPAKQQSGPGRNQYDYDRPHPDYNFKHRSGGDADAPDGGASEQPGPTPMPSRPLSKLDLAELKLRKARANGEYNSDASEEEMEEDETDSDEDKRQRLLIVSSGLPEKLDKSPEKMKFLSHFGLATHTQCSGQYPYLGIYIPFHL